VASGAALRVAPDPGELAPVIEPRALLAAWAIFFVLLAYFGLEAMRQLAAERIGIDDANIYLRYARNVADGFGIVWNPHRERVEGGTSFLWTLICSLAYMTTPAPEMLLFWFNVGVLALALAAWLNCHWRLVALMTQGRMARSGLVAATALSAVGWIVASPSYTIWTTTTLLDTGVWAASLLMSSVLTLALANDPHPRQLRAALALSLWLVAWARPEGFVLSGAFMVFVAGMLWHRRMPLAEIRRCLGLPIVVVIGANLGLFLFRRAYFGFWLPNTYYTKVGADLAFNLRQGWRYFRSFVHAYPLVLFTTIASLFIIAIWLISVLRGSKETDELRRFLIDFAGISSSLFLMGVFNGVYVGGDQFGGWRFFQPYWPFAFTTILSGPLLLVVGLRRSEQSGQKWRVLAGTLAFCAIAVVLTYGFGEVKWNDLREKAGRSTNSKSPRSVATAEKCSTASLLPSGTRRSASSRQEGFLWLTGGSRLTCSA
jgi:arabinofuranosyltransferase